MAGKGKPAPKAGTTTESTTIKKSAGRPKSPSRNKSPPKSPARTKSPSRTSPARTKSPSRTSPARTKSPSRTSPARTKSEPTKIRPSTPTRTNRVRSPARVKNSSPIAKTSTPLLVPLKRSPIRRSPGRVAKETSVDKDRDVAPKKTKIIIDTDTDSDNPESIPEIKEKPKAAVRGRTRRTDIDKEEVQDLKKPDADGTLGVIRRFTRSSQNKDVERVVHLKHFDSLTVTKRLGEFSDEDELSNTNQKELKEYVGHKKFIEFSGAYGALILIPVIPLTVLTLYTFCTQSKCTFSSLPNLPNFKLFSTYFDAKSHLGVAAYFTLLSILTAIPTGGKKLTGPPNKYGKFDYVLNGLLSLIVMLFIFSLLQFKKIDVASYVVNHIFQILVSSILLGTVVSFLAYVRSFYVPVSGLNAYAVGKNRLYGFVIGRELNPRVFSVVDLKLLFFRASIIATILIDFAYLSKSLSGQYKIENADNTFIITPKLLSLHPTLFIFTLIHAYYFLDSLIFESSWLTSFTNQQEGFGYLLTISYAVAPFFNALLVKFVAENNVELVPWKLVLVVIVYAAGLFLYRRSNNEKDAFRKNPYSPSLSHLETIPTTQGKKLLASSYWGYVRHPNYVGDIIIRLSWAPFVLCTLPLLSIVISILILVQRTLRDNAHCKLKYGAAWDRYRNRVRYALVPKVY